VFSKSSVFPIYPKEDVKYLCLVLLIFASILFLTACQSSFGPPPTVAPTIAPTATATRLNTDGPAISPLLVGNNVWMYPDVRVWNIAGQAGLRIIRIGGNAYDRSMPSNSMLMDWVNHIKAMDAEPMIQVSRFDGAEAAANVVKYFNLETGNKVKYWNIGNEPYCNKATVAAAMDVASYIKSIAAAMKAVDPTIKIFAPDECDFYDEYYAALLKGDDSAADISGKLPGKDLYYIDGISWHRYVGYPPENVGIDGLTTAGANDFLARIKKTRALVDQANAARHRIGVDALQWGIGEFNSNEGGRVCSYENGQMFAEIYGYMMKYGGTYGETWSMLENGGSCRGTDFSFVDAKVKPRSTFYHMQMVSENFSGFYLDGISNLDGIRAFGAVDTKAQRITVMLLNIDVTASHACTIRLNANPIKTGECRVSLPVGLPVDLAQTIGSQTSIVLVFDLQGHLFKTVTYAKGDDAPTTGTTK
jgi:hypothetical protein